MKLFLKIITIGCMIPFRWMLQRVHFRPEVVILFYHSISESDDPYSVSPDVFDAQLSILKRVSNPVSLNDIVAFANGNKQLPDGAVAVTFDDGYRDVLTNALPLLRRHHIPATVFISTRPMHDAFGNTHEVLSNAEIRRLAEDPLIEIGSHGVSHNKLARLDNASLRGELEESKTSLERLTGKPCRVIAYPKGSVTPLVAETARNVGYLAGLTTIHGTIRPGDDPYYLKRVIVKRDVGLFTFRWRLTRIVDWLSRIWETYVKYE